MGSSTGARALDTASYTLTVSKDPRLLPTVYDLTARTAELAGTDVEREIFGRRSRDFHEHEVLIRINDEVALGRSRGNLGAVATDEVSDHELARLTDFVELRGRPAER